MMGFEPRTSGLVPSNAYLYNCGSNPNFDKVASTGIRTHIPKGKKLKVILLLMGFELETFGSYLQILKM